MTVSRYYSSVARRTTLTSDITSGGTSMQVAAATGFPSTYPYTLIIDQDTVNEEIVEVSARSGTTLTVVRGVDGTSGIAHTAGAAVEHGVSARDFSESRQHEDASENVHGLGPGVALVGDTAVQTLTNKTLTSPTINGASVTGTVTGGTLSGWTVTSGTLGSDLAAGGFKVTGLADPSSAQDAVTKNWAETGMNSQLVDATTQAANAAASAASALSSANSAALSAASVDATATASAELRQFGAAGSVLDNLPARVHPAEQLLKQSVLWLDAAHSSAGDQTIKNLGWGGSALNARSGSTSGVDSNDPKFLDWSGENYVYQPGVEGNYLRVPDEAALDITDEIDVRCHVALDDWVNGSRQTILSKWRASGNNRSWLVVVEPTGAISFQYTTDGSVGGFAYNSTVVPTVSNGDALWIRATWIVDNGTGNSEANFYTSVDGATWSALGSPVTSAVTNPIFSGTGDVSISAFNHSALKVYRFQVLDGIEGTPVLDVDCSQITSGAAESFTALTGHPVFIHRSTSGRKSVAVVSPVWLFGTDDYMEVADNDLLDFGASDSFTVLVAYREWATWPSNGRIIDKRGDITDLIGYGLRHAGTSTSWAANVDDGPNSVSYGLQAVTYGELTTVGVLVDRSAQTLTTVDNGVIGSGASDISSIGDLTNSYPLRIGRLASSTFYGDFEFVAAAVFRRALTSGELETLSTYFQSRG